MPTVISVSSQGTVNRSLVMDDLARFAETKNGIIWADFAGVPAQTELDLLQQAFDLIPQILAHLTKTRWDRVLFAISIATRR